jgi:GTP-binding protein
VVADIPGLIEGAHQGHGLGTQFLRHVERTRLLAHLVDVGDPSERDAAADFQVIVEELRQFDPRLAAKPMVVVASKLDVMQDRTRLGSLEQLCRERGLDLYPISAHSGEGVERLQQALADKLEQIRAAEPAAAGPETPSPGVVSLP